MASKGRCPSCGAGMKVKRRFCGECGRRNPLFPARGSAVKAVRPVLVKSAQPVSVADIRHAQLLREIRGEPDPGRRQVPIGQLVDLMQGALAAMSEHMDYQGPIAAAHGVTLTSDTTGAPIGSSFHDHAAGMTVDVQQAGFAVAADRGRALHQMGQRCPSGLPGQPAEATAPTGVGARFRQNAPLRDGYAVYLTGPGAR